MVRFTPERPPVDDEALARLDGVEQVSVDRGEYVVHGTGPVLARVARVLAAQGLEPVDLRVELPTLEDAYLSLTQEEGREGTP